MRITSKGQVTIPGPIRRAAGFLPGTEVEFESRGGEVILRRRTVGSSKRERQIREHLEKMRGTAEPGWTTERIMSLTRGDD